MPHRGGDDLLGAGPEAYISVWLIWQDGVCSTVLNPLPPPTINDSATSASGVPVIAAAG